MALGAAMVRGHMNDASELEARIRELEIRITEQQRVVEDLSDVLVAQQRQIDELERRVQRLADKVKAEPGLVEADSDDKPPHY